MQSTALALMACENAIWARLGKLPRYPSVPIYDLIIFCDLGLESSWVYYQVEFIRRACVKAGIRFEILDAPLYEDFKKNFGERRTISVPWWTRDNGGYQARMPRNCTIDYKVELIAKFVRWEVLGYKKGKRLKPEDIKAHEMHLGFSIEEKKRCGKSKNDLFVNRYPLVEMGLNRADNYAYIRNIWGLDTKASACAFCPCHRNYFYKQMKENEGKTYQEIVGIDNLLRDKTPKPPMDSDIFISRSRKRIEELTPMECNDVECFTYKSRLIWNGF